MEPARLSSFPSSESHQRDDDKAGFRFYNQYEMPKNYATREITVRLHYSPEGGVGPRTCGDPAGGPGLQSPLRKAG